jgi:hypothetical protein
MKKLLLALSLLAFAPSLWALGFYASGGGNSSGWTPQSSTQAYTLRELVIGSANGESNNHQLEINSGAGPAGILLNKSSVGPGWLHGITVKVQGVIKGTFGFDENGSLGLTGQDITATATQVFSIFPSSQVCCGGFTSGTGGMNLGQSTAFATFQIRYATNTAYALGISSIPAVYTSITPGDFSFTVSTAGKVTAAIGYLATPPAVQTIAGGNTIAADACGGIKRITSAGVVTTDTTNTFTAPSSDNAGCVLRVINTGANNITLDNNALFFSPGAADVVMTANDAIIVGSDGSKWYALSALVAN